MLPLPSLRQSIEYGIQIKTPEYSGVNSSHMHDIEKLKAAAWQHFSFQAKIESGGKQFIFITGCKVGCNQRIARSNCIAATDCPGYPDVLPGKSPTIAYANHCPSSRHPHFTVKRSGPSIQKAPQT